MPAFLLTVLYSHRKRQESSLLCVGVSQLSKNVVSFIRAAGFACARKQSFRTPDATTLECNTQAMLGPLLVQPERSSGRLLRPYTRMALVVGLNIRPISDA